MIRRQLIAFVLEGAISAQLVLFAVFLLSSPPRRPPALYFLAGLTAGLALMMTGNLLISATGWFWVSDVILFLDLLVPPAIYLYVLEMHHPARPLRYSDLFHLAPALIGMLMWTTGVLSSMDVYVNICWFTYLTIASYYFLTHYRGYGPAPRQRFLMMLMTVLLAAGLLRLIIVSQSANQSSFREGLPYLLILCVLFLSTCQILFTALRHPNLLSVPGSNMKYALSTVDQFELDRLDQQLVQILNERKPYLNPDFTLAELASLLGAQSRHVSQLINTHYKMNFSAYMNFWRAQTAAHLLAIAPEKPIKVVMHESGFKSKSIFNREFSRHFGMNPGTFRDNKIHPSLLGAGSHAGESE